MLTPIYVCFSWLKEEAWLSLLVGCLNFMLCSYMGTCFHCRTVQD
ncbi:hypothetical protein Gotri_022670 [Gossypium trilobum]|uniref:Uncharacterized protein n=1 Tax=Gossypium trilobum TaxID=34281 RepID=A0A7J9DH09_9ROSI|nr:hypothetical protein [Gossypium trilobum]